MQKSVSCIYFHLLFLGLFPTTIANFVRVIFSFLHVERLCKAALTRVSNLLDLHSLASELLVLSVLKFWELLVVTTELQKLTVYNFDNQIVSH